MLGMSEREMEMGHCFDGGKVLVEIRPVPRRTQSLIHTRVGQALGTQV